MNSKSASFARSAVYNVQVKTFTVARQVSAESCHLLRIVRAYRTEACRQLRNDIAAAVRAIRAAKTSFPPVPQHGHATRLVS